MMGYVEVSLEKAFQIQKKECDYNMKELRGAIKAFFIALGYPNKEISMPKGETAGSWLDKLANCVESQKQQVETLLFLEI